MASHHEMREAHDRSAPGGSIVYKAITLEGEQELERPTSALAWSGLAAGLSMGFSSASEALLHAALPESASRPLVAKLGYSVGFLIVVLGRQQLFTENTLTVMLPALKRRDVLMFANVTRLWATVLAANLVGATAFAWVAARTSIFAPDVRAAMLSAGLDAMAPSIGTVLLRGIMAGWLIALMVWLLPFAETARVWVIVIITYVVGIGHFSHVIAGSVDTIFVVAAGQRPGWEYVTRFLLPALGGNVIGGVSLVAAIAHAQFVAGEEMPA
jgi:formate/nitrite transporter FocA (FNT family)